MSPTSTDKGEQRFSIRQYEPNKSMLKSVIPGPLRERDQWIVTHDSPGEPYHKGPKYPRKGWNEGNTLPFEDAIRIYRQREDTGVGFVFSPSDPFIGFDLDNVRPNESFTDESISLVERLDSYTEVSSSGTGLHIIAEGSHRSDRKSRGNLETGHIEVYDQDRYFVLTGEIYSDQTAVTARPETVREIQEAHLPLQKPERSRAVTTGTDTNRSLVVAPEQVHRTIQAYVQHSSTDVDSDVLRLWEGSDEGHPSRSEADLAFVAQLYFWCKGRRRLMDACFRYSGRMREKWDADRGETTYGELTIEAACNTNDKVFQGRYVN